MAAEHLIIQTAFLGDLLLGIPLFKELRRLRPDDKITLLCRRGLGDLIVRLGLVDEAIEADKTSAESWRNAARRLRSRRFEWLICPHQSPRSALLVASLKATTKIGYRQGLLGLAFDVRVPRSMELPEAMRQLALLAPLEPQWTARLETFARGQTLAGGQAAQGALMAVPEFAQMTVASLRDLRAATAGASLSPRAMAVFEELDLRGRRSVFIAPSSVWTTKMWLGSRYAEVARHYLDSGFRVVITGSPDEKSVCADVACAAPGAVSIAGRLSLFESAELLATATLLICNDSGAMHMAAMANVPTVSIFGPTVLEFGYRPWQTSAVVVEVPRAQMPCRPCGKHGARVCPLGTHDCMKLVSSDQVIAASRDLLASVSLFPE